MTEINLEKVASEFSGAILFDGANSYKVIQAYDFIDFHETKVKFRGEVGELVESVDIYETMENSKSLDISILNKETPNVNKLIFQLTEEMSKLTEFERNALIKRLQQLDN